ncbi:MAG TPA: hypothetical protein VF885_05835 [Arthrobacter sp.]
MQTINLDAVIKLNDETSTYTDDQPNSGIEQTMFAQDHFSGPQLQMFYKTHRGTDLYNTYSVGGWEAGNFHRVVCQGPRVDGPHAWMNENATVLTAHKQAKRETISVEPGDHVVLRGTEYEIVKTRTGHMSLTPVTA